MTKSTDKWQDQAIETRQQFWQSIGQLDSDVLTHAINPAFMGGPAWPSLHQAFVKVNTTQSVILASDGLSNPYDDWTEPNHGFEMECFIESDDPALRAPIYEVNQTWQFQVLYEFAQQAASFGNIAELLEQYQTLSMELYDIDLPEKFLNDEGRVGVLIGIDAPNLSKNIISPYGEIRLVSVKLLTAAELDFIVQHGSQARSKLVELFREQGSYHLSSLERESVI